MIGLTALAIGLLWLALSVLLAIKLPKWFGASKPVWSGLLGCAIFLILMVGPFVDHVVGMRQFQKLCDEQTGLQIYPNSVNTKRGQETSSKRELVNGAVISINRTVSTITDLDTGEVIARYNYFSTKGGVIGSVLMLGGEHVCSIDGPRHPQHDQYVTLKSRISLIYGEAK